MYNTPDDFSVRAYNRAHNQPDPPDVRDHLDGQPRCAACGCFMRYAPDELIIYDTDWLTHAPLWRATWTCTCGQDHSLEL